MPTIGPAPSTYRPTAAGAASTDIWLGDLVRQGDSLAVRNLVNVTNRPGYDNQPAFTPDGRALFYVAAVDTTQTEIFRYDLATRAIERVTRTEGVSEFSPTVIPGQPAFSAIHEERGKQHLWRYRLDGTPIGPLFATAEPVGYHAWVDERAVVMFILGNPPTLRVGDAVRGWLRVLAERPGRSIHRIPGAQAISFVRKVSEGEWWIERLDPRTGTSERIVRTRPGREDYAWTPAGEILMSEGPALFRWTAASGWTHVHTMTVAGAGDLSRLAVSPDGQRIALVAAQRN